MADVSQQWSKGYLAAHWQVLKEMVGATKAPRLHALIMQRWWDDNARDRASLYVTAAKDVLRG